MGGIFERIKPLAPAAWGWVKAHPAPVAVALGVILVFYSTFMISALRIRHRVANYLIEATGGDLTYKKIRVTPTMSIELDDVELTAKDSVLKLPDFKAKRVFARADLATFLGGRVRAVDVKVDDPVITLYKGPDGKYNLSRWVKRMGACTDRSAGASAPDRVTVRGGRVMLEPPPGATWVDAIELARIDGYFGRTVENNIAFKARAVVFRSAVSISGGLVPCDPNQFQIIVNSDNFDFSGLRDLAGELYGDAIPTERMPAGAGSLRLTVDGSYENPTVKGQVSLRDFDTEFLLAGRVLHVSDLRAGIGSEHVSGSGTFDFTKPEIPFKLEIELRKLRTERIFRKVFGFRTAPEGALSGNVNLRGELVNNTIEWDDGEITVEYGIVKIPPLGRSGETGPAANPIAVPFKKLTARLNGAGDRLNFFNIKVESDIYTASGSASIGAGSGKTLVAPDAPYSLQLNFTANDAAAAAELIPSLHDRVGGELSGSIDIRGAFKQRAGFAGAAHLSLRKGFIGNPYADQYGAVADNIQLDSADAQLTLTSDTAEIKSASLSGNGIYINAHGAVGYDGSLNLIGRAQLSPDWASKFVGLGQYINGADMFGTEMYEAGFSVGGTVQVPEQLWMQPSVVGELTE